MEFFQTGMGRKFFEHDVPELIRAIQENNKLKKAELSLKEKELALKEKEIELRMRDINIKEGGHL